MVWKLKVPIKWYKNMNYLEYPYFIYIWIIILLHSPNFLRPSRFTDFPSPLLYRFPPNCTGRREFWVLDLHSWIWRFISNFSKLLVEKVNTYTYIPGEDDNFRSAAGLSWVSNCQFYEIDEILSLYMVPDFESLHDSWCMSDIILISRCRHVTCIN